MEEVDDSITHESGINPFSNIHSVDLAVSPTEHTGWVRMDELRSSPVEFGSAGYVSKKNRSRSPSVTSASSEESTWINEGPIQRWINFILGGFGSITQFPILKDIFHPFERLESEVGSHQSSSRFQGWRMGILLGSCMSAAILVFNLAIIILLAVKPGFKDGTVNLPISLNSKRMSQVSSAIHVVINILSTILLSASNYTMQVVSSPTRKDLNKAHSAGRWYDIALLSIHNLIRIPRRRSFLCLAMGLTSIPLHLFFNSAAIYIATTNEYEYSLVNVSSSEWLQIASDTGFKPLSNREWRRLYSTNVIDSGDLYLGFNETAREISKGAPSGYPCTSVDLPANMSLSNNSPGSNLLSLLDIGKVNWTRIDHLTPDNSELYAHIVSARARIIPERKSRIQLSLTFLIVVVICNALKLAMMLSVLFLEKSDFIVTLGDAAASYLERPERSTERLCVANKATVILKTSSRHDKHDRSDYLDELTEGSYGTWRKQSHPYSSALDRERQIGSYFIFIVIGMMFFLVFVLVAMGKFADGWGSSSKTIFWGNNHSPQQLLLAWFANAPQLVLSFCYMAINSECTSLAGAWEWNQFGTRRKGLRVTKPMEKQRSTYFLQLPYKFSLPLLSVSGILHWLLSQSVFLVQVDVFDRNGVSRSMQSGIGLSTKSIVALCGTFYLLVLAVGTVGRRRLRIRIPFAASCSLVISAACHPPPDDQSAHLRKVQWGVVEERMFDGKRHCTLTSRPVSKPKEGTIYL